MLPVVWFVVRVLVSAEIRRILATRQYSRNCFGRLSVHTPRKPVLRSGFHPANSSRTQLGLTWHSGRFNKTDPPRDLITNAYALPEIDKVQLTIPLDDKTERYQPCEELIASGSLVIQKAVEGAG